MGEIAEFMGEFSGENNPLINIINIIIPSPLNLAGGLCFIILLGIGETIPKQRSIKRNGNARSQKAHTKQ